MTIWVRCRVAELEFVIKYCSKRAYYEYFLYLCKNIEMDISTINKTIRF